MSDDIRLDRGDVTVEEINEECDECTHGLTGAGFVVAVDFRSAGQVQRFGRYCLTCAEEIAARIRDGLPAEAAE